MKFNLPSYPEERGAHECEEDVVRLKYFAAEAVSIAHHDGGHQSSDAGGDMDHVTSRKIKHARLVQETIWVPY